MCITIKELIEHIEAMSEDYKIQYSRDDVNYDTFYNDFARYLAKTKSRTELEKMKYKNDAELKKSVQMRHNAIEKQPGTMRAAHARNMMSGASQTMFDISAALEIYDLFPENTKDAKNEKEKVSADKLVKNNSSRDQKGLKTSASKPKKGKVAKSIGQLEVDWKHLGKEEVALLKQAFEMGMERVKSGKKLSGSGVSSEAQAMYLKLKKEYTDNDPFPIEFLKYFNKGEVAASSQQAWQKVGLSGPAREKYPWE